MWSVLLKHKIMSLLSKEFQIPQSFKRSISIALTTGFVTSSFIVLINFFNQTVAPSGFMGNLSNIAIIALFWLILSLIALKKIGESLNNDGFSDAAFYLIYLLSIAPLEQLTFNIYRYLNHGMVDSLFFIGIVVLENLVFVPIVLKLIDVDEKNRKKVVVGLVIFCVLISILIGFIK